MAIMRTNRLTSKTTAPAKGGRKFTSASELEAQDAAYNKYKSDLPIYEKKMKRYNEESKIKDSDRSYANLGGKQNARKLNSDELSKYNYNSMNNPNDDSALEYRTVEVNKGYNKKSSDKDFMIGVYHHTSNPIKPTAPQKSTPADWANVQLDKMPTKKASITSSKSNLKKLKATPELPSFEGPTKSAGIKNSVDMNPLAQGAYTKGNKGRYAKQVVESVGKTGKTRGFDRERKQFEAFARSGGDQTKSMFKAEAKQSRQIGAQYRAEGNAEGAEMMRQEAKQFRKAAQFAGKVGKGNNKYFDRNMVSEFRGSKENAANRNTMEAKIKAAGAKAANNRNTLY
jgi:hypothetical protein